MSENCRNCRENVKVKAKIGGGHEVQLAPFYVTQCNQQSYLQFVILARALNESHQIIFSSRAWLSSPSFFMRIPYA